KMNKAERLLWTQLGREPTLEEIAEEASLPIEQAREVRAAERASTSLDQPVGEEEDAVFGDFLAGDGPLPEDQVEVTLRSQALSLALSALGDRERQVIVLRYGLGDREPETLEEIGRRLGGTRGGGGRGGGGGPSPRGARRGRGAGPRARGAPPSRSPRLPRRACRTGWSR